MENYIKKFKNYVITSPLIVPALMSREMLKMGKNGGRRCKASENRSSSDWMVDARVRTEATEVGGCNRM